MNKFDFLPIDVKLDYDKEQLIDYFHKNKQRGSFWWNLVVLRETDNDNYKGLRAVRVKWNEDYNWKWAPGFEQKFPQLIRDLTEKLPFRFVSNVMLMSNYSEVHPHNDVSPNEDEFPNIEKAKKLLGGDMEPSMYRILIDGSIDNTFFLSDPQDEKDGRKWVDKDPVPGVDYNYKTVTMPKDTDVMVFPTFGITHGSLMPTSPKILLTVHGFLDEDRHKELLKRSYEKYKDFAVSYFK